MNKSLAWLQKEAQKRQREFNKLKQDSRYQKVIGRFVHEKLLISSDIIPRRNLITVDDALWAGNIEVRILELLPAILLKHPKLFLIPKPLPKDLIRVLQEIKKGKAKTPFRGIEADRYESWVKRIGRKGKYPTLLKTYRFNQEDLEILEKLRKNWNSDEISVIRKALKFSLSNFQK
ncbi:MAG: hypothetical protein HYY61_01560 [Deltaproteobacteria bacterium]|nr:hypothetical protein [Deltaproteobacteria bacterium]